MRIKRRRIFALFKSIFLKTDLWVTPGVFTVKKSKIGKGNLYLTENRLSRNEKCCAADNHNYMCHTCAKEFWDSNFNLAVLDKISNFNEIALNSTYSHKSQFLKYICNFLDQLLHPFKFHGRGMSGILFFNFASCEPLRVRTVAKRHMRSFMFTASFILVSCVKLP